MKNNKGSILVWVLVTSTLLLTTIMVGVSLLQDTAKILETQMEYYGQTTAIAKSGLFDALGWFRRQTTQPVTTFNPQRDLGLLPPVNDTDDPAIGIVREIDVNQSRQLYGRYEVISSTVVDVTTQRGFSGSGTVWHIESVGYLYLKLDGMKPYNVYPNRIVSQIRLATEIRRVSIVLPAQAAICAGNPGQTVIGNKTRIIGGDQYAIVYPPAMGTPNINPGATVTGTPTATSQVLPYDDAPEDVFGLTENELRSIADYYVTAVDQLPNPIPDYKIVFFEGNAAFNSTTPLNGTGIFYITGNMTIAANSNSSYNGIIYCKGQYRQLAPSMVNGSIIGQGLINIESTGDISEVDYDADILGQVQSYTGQYRFRKGFYKVE